RSTPGCRAKSSSCRRASATAGTDPESPRLGRRDFLGVLGGAAVASYLPLRAGARLLDPVLGQTARTSAADPFRARLPIPEELRGEHLNIPIREAEVQALPGRPTRMWTYGGVFPGPTIRRPAGRRTEVEFEHRLPRKAGELTVHLHGGHNRS